MSSQIADRMRFRLVWAIFSAALRYSSFTERRFIVPSAGPRAATHVTLVARLPSHVTAPIREIATSLGEVDPNHYFYPADTIHLTNQNLDWAVCDVEDLECVRDQLRAVVGSFPPTRMMAAGLGVSPDTVFVQIFPADETPANLRREINATTLRHRASWETAAGESISGSSRVRWLFRNMAFANVARFAGKVAPLFIREIARHRSQHFGEFVLHGLEFVGIHPA